MTAALFAPLGAPDTRIFAQNPDLARARIALSTGLADADGADTARPKYVEDAKVPGKPWRAPSDAEWADLSMAPGTMMPIHQSIALIRLPDAIIEPLMAQGLEAAKSPLNAFETSKGPGAVAAISALTKFLESLGASPNTQRALGFSAKRRGLATTTINTRKRRRAGLHLDRFDNKPLDQLAQARMRINVNIGQGARHFLYCAHSVPQMAASIDGSLPPNEVGRAFLQRNSTYPAVRVRVEPCEAYLAATDFLIHDGSSQDNPCEWDIHMSVLCNLTRTDVLQWAL